MKNVKQFVLNVKRATGNLKDAVAEAEAKAQKGKNSSKSVKPGAYIVCAIFPFFFVDPFFRHLFVPVHLHYHLTVYIHFRVVRCYAIRPTLLFKRIFSLPFIDPPSPFLDRPVYSNITVLQFTLFHSWSLPFGRRSTTSPFVVSVSEETIID